ncbi:hypothetical protein Tco_0764637 [Tanacetum coccineum]
MLHHEVEERVGRVGRGARRTREPVRRNNVTTGELDGQGNDRGVEANGGVGGVPDFSTIIAQQLQNLLPTLLAQVGKQGNNQGNNRNQNGDAVNDNIQGDGGAIVYTRWIEKMESVQDMSGCGDNQKVKYTAGSFVGKALTWWNSQIHTRRAGHHTSWLVPHLVTPEIKRIERYIYGLALQICRMVAVSKPPTIQKVVQKAGTLTDEAIRNGSLKKNCHTPKRGLVGNTSSGA